jgi:hypothetical protein
LQRLAQVADGPGDHSVFVFDLHRIGAAIPGAAGVALRRPWRRWPAGAARGRGELRQPGPAAESALPSDAGRRAEFGVGGAQLGRSGRFGLRQVLGDRGGRHRDRDVGQVGPLGVGATPQCGQLAAVTHLQDLDGNATEGVDQRVLQRRLLFGREHPYPYLPDKNCCHDLCR